MPTLPLREMSGPNPERFQFLDFDGVIAFAHRGGTRAAPENTVASFEHATALGYRYLETDVHVTADGVLVAFHDPDLVRIADDRRHISQIGWSELSEIEFRGHTVPRLDDLLQKFSNARFNIDPKTDSAVDPLAELIRDHDAIDRVCLGSFSDKRIERARALLGPGLCTSPGPRATLGAILPWPVAGDHPCVSVPSTVGRYRLGKRVVRRLHDQGYRIHVWTVNDEEEMNRLVDLGVDGIMTDECELLKKVLMSRDMWT